MGITKGKKLMIWVKDTSGDYTSIGYCTNHTLSTSASTISLAESAQSLRRATFHLLSGSLPCTSFPLTRKVFPLVS